MPFFRINLNVILKKKFCFSSFVFIFSNFSDDESSDNDADLLVPVLPTKSTPEKMQRNIFRKSTFEQMSRGNILWSAGWKEAKNLKATC